MTVTLASPKANTDFDAEPRPYHWTVEEFYRAVDAGVFEHPKRLELIQGRIVENMGQNPRHSALTSRLARRLRAEMEPRFYVREEKPIHIAADSEPEPDVAVLTGRAEDYDERHPTPADAALLIEVSDTTVTYDTGGKARLYAQAAIGDYWVILVEAQTILVHRDPTPEGYGSVTRVGAEGVVTPLAAEAVRLPVCDLLGLRGAM